MKHVFFGRQRALHIQFIRYICAGGSAALLDLLFFAVAVRYFDIHYLFAALFTYTLGFAWMHALSVFWIFESRHGRVSEFLMTLIIATCGLLWTEILLYICIEWIVLDAIVAKILAQLLVLFWNFGMRKQFVFH